MRRVITQIGQSIYEWLFTRQAQDNMVALAKLSAAVLGTSTQFNGLAVSPTSPASMQVSVAPGEIYMLAALEGTIYGTLAADTTHQIVKQGISLDASLLTLTAPSVAGQSINYLIQATFQETDISVDPTTGTSPVVLQFYNDSNPTVPYSGPNNSGATSNTFRQGSVVLSAKAGISATTGSQVTPSPDSGYVGIAVVTVANGQTTITSGNITAYASAPSINSTLHGLSPVFSVPVQVGAATSALQAVQLGQVQQSYAWYGQSQTFSSSGTSTFTVPAGVYRIRCRAWGGGGGGGASTGAAGGGGGGGYGEGIYSVTPGQTISVTVGIGGLGANTGAVPGGTGGSTSIGALLTASGGTGGSQSVQGLGGAGGGTMNPIGGQTGIGASGPYGAGDGGGAGGGGGLGARGGATSGAVNGIVGTVPGGGGSGGYNAGGGPGAIGRAVIEW